MLSTPYKVSPILVEYLLGPCYFESEHNDCYRLNWSFMKYKGLKQGIKAIAEIADGLPEMFRVRCFELLLQHLLPWRQDYGFAPFPCAS